MTEGALLDSIRADWERNHPRQVYADWLEERENTREASVVRAELDVHAGRPGAWERLHQARGAASRRWLFCWEQPSLARTLPLPLPEPKDDPFRGRPDIGEEALDFDWIGRWPDRALPPREPFSPADYAGLQQTLSARGYSLPEEMHRLFLRRGEVFAKIPTFADSYFSVREHEPFPLLEGLLLPFYLGDGARGLWMHRGGAQAVVGFTLLDRYLSYDWREPPPDAIELGERLHACSFWYAGPSLAAFLYHHEHEMLALVQQYSR